MREWSEARWSCSLTSRVSPSPGLVRGNLGPERNRNLRVVIDGQIVSGSSGGVEGVLAGLASGLSRLEDDGTTYEFVVWEGYADWLSPFVAGPARTVMRSPPFLDGRTTTRRERLADAVPVARELWRRLPRRRPPPDVPMRDGFFDRLEPDVVHMPIQRGFLTDAPSIYHPHDLQHVHLPEMFSAEERQWRDLWYGALCRQAAMVAVTSTWTKVDVEGHFGLEPGRVQVIPFAPPLAATPAPSDADIATIRRRLGLPDQYLLYPAQSWPHKNHRRLIDALAILRERDQLSITLIATGTQTAHFPDIQRHIIEQGMESNVIWTGFLSLNDLRSVYAGARGVVIPSRFEAASGPLWEAFLMGVPAACSNITSLPDQAGNAALVFDPEEPAAMADAIRTLWLDEDVRLRLITRGRDRVAGFTWDRTARLFRAHYRRLAGRDLGAEDLALISAPPIL